ncbi:hypothetical protein V5E97_18180 [Singulisphaera sp. Ch08]|uniref:Uncharacterized protein n=1 Tax=Singulisphaera sp. Ch08 TaxID=3120278 RepID=A0AAU7CQZ7_9BACT
MFQPVDPIDGKTGDWIGIAKLDWGWGGTGVVNTGGTLLDNLTDPVNNAPDPTAPLYGHAMAQPLWLTTSTAIVNAGFIQL